MQYLTAADGGLDAAFIVFDAQDSGCLSYGVEADGRCWFVKKANTPAARESLTRALAFHTAVRHPAIVRPEVVFDGTDGPTVVYPWRDGTVLNHATVHGADRSGLTRFQTQPIGEVFRAITAILDAHLVIAAAGYIAVDLYDGCFLYDFDAHHMWLIDLDEYRPGPFILASDRLPGSRSYMAPEELVRGKTIDHRTTVHALGRTLHYLLNATHEWRGTDAQRAVVDHATQPDPADRYPDVASMVAAWRQA